VSDPSGQRAATPADLYAGCYRRLVGVVALAAGSRAEAEDVVQEAFVRVLTCWTRIQGYDDPEAWVRQVAFRLLSNRRRRLRNAVLARNRALPPAPVSSGTGIRNVAATFTVLPAPVCRTSQLALSLGRGGVALGTSYRQVVFQNRGPAACTLTGYPGLSFADSAGHQLGLSALAVNLTSQPITTVTLAPGGFANASVGIVSPGNYQTTPQPSSSTCHPAQASYLRVYPPNQRNAVLLAFPADVCSTASGRPLVTPTRPGRSDTAVG
jgi:RNA polymerase sigma-70 factor (ECF subfamily)